MGIQSVAKDLYRAASERSPEILVGFGLASLLTAIILAVKATPKAEELIVEAEDEKEDELTVWETVKAAWTPYIPAFVAFTTGGICVIGGMKIKSDRHAELAAACAISQGIIKRYDEKCEKIVGKEKAEEIKSEVNRDVAKTPEVRNTITQLPPSNIAGVHPFWDRLSNAQFYAAPEMLVRAEVCLNKRLFTGLESYVTISDLYDELNEQGVYPKLRHTSVSPMLGWTAEMGGVEFDMDSDGVPFEHDHWDNGTPCYVMGFKHGHEPDYIR